MSGLRVGSLSPQLLRRVAALFVFVGLIVAFRHLALMLVTFVVVSRALSALGQLVTRSLGMTGPSAQRKGVLLVLGLFVLILAGAIWLSVRQGGRWWAAFVHLHNGQTLPEILQDFQEDLATRIPSWLPVDGLKDRVPHVVQPAVDYLRATGRVLMYVLIGIILAVIYLLDREPVDALVAGLPEESVPGQLRRYFGFLFEAVIITITLQVLVALVNTLLTLPVLIVLRLPHIPALTAMIFVSSLVPVVGNLVSGAVLIAVSYLYRGLWAVAFFVVTTFVLHKIEAYYLNPRLAARHVNLPSLVLVISLILHEHVFGLVGLFLSFPVLYIGLNILHDLRCAATGGSPEDVAVTAGTAAPSPPPAASSKAGRRRRKG